MVTTLFFMWGFLTCLNDILVPHLKSIFDLNYAEVMLVQFCFFSAYFVFSIPSGKIIERIGYQKMMVAGLLTMGLGALLFIPAASVPSFPLFLAALIILAAGITALQVCGKSLRRSARPGANRLQPLESDAGVQFARHNSRAILWRDADSGSGRFQRLPRRTACHVAASLHTYRLEQASSVKLPYLAIALALILLGIVIGSSICRTFPKPKADTPSSNDSIWKHRNLVMGSAPSSLTSARKSRSAASWSTS